MWRDKRIAMLVFVAAAMLLMAGCGAADEAAEAGDVATVELGGERSELPTVDPSAKTGWALVQDKCTVCHPLETVTQARLDWDEWQTAVEHMLANGASLNDDEKSAVLAYLETRDQVAAVGPSVVQQECMVCHTTERVNAAVLDWTGWEAAVDHMIENGADIEEAQRAVIVEYLAVRGPQSVQ